MGNVGISKDQEFFCKIFKSLSTKFHQIASKKEANHLFLNTVVEYAGVPMIAFEEKNQEVRLINEGAKELFKKPHFRKLSSPALIDQNLVKLFLKLENGENQLYRFEDESGWKELSIVAKRLQLQGGNYKLIALHNIKKELDEKELESWQKLIRVMTHEIKNSVIPISTLSEVLEQMLIPDQHNLIALTDLTNEDEEDLKIGIKTIAKRSKGLAGFVNAYGEVAKIPIPKLSDCSLNQTILHVYELYKPVFTQANRFIELDIPTETFNTQIDADLIEQVLINLIKNGLEAIDENGKVTISLSKTVRSFIIDVTDDGKGISNEVMSNIFTPFFTTKEEGSGIGLSLSRQIIRKHHGDLIVKSKVEIGSSFKIILPIEINDTNTST